ncbi:MAG: hypothetical protein FWE40_02925 [Oscillospiraceae bacterium]|nr:hypothetical protein [Oscillospiraceae bacterium]
MADDAALDQPRNPNIMAVVARWFINGKEIGNLFIAGEEVADTFMGGVRIYYQG